MQSENRLIKLIATVKERPSNRNWVAKTRTNRRSGEATGSFAPIPLPKCKLWQAHPSLTTAAEAWITAGAPHHTVLSTAVGIEEFTDLAEILDTELLHIDAATTMRSFIKEVRWSQAYYRLAAGF